MMTRQRRSPKRPTKRSDGGLADSRHLGGGSLKAEVADIIASINRVFGDTSVSQTVTLGLMEEIEEAANMNAAAIREDLKRAERGR